MQDLLKAIKLIIKSYSQLPIPYLFDNYLMLNIFLFSDQKIAIDFLHNQQTISKSKIQIFLKGTQNKKKNIRKYYIYIAINHPHLLSLHKIFFHDKKPHNRIDNLICLTNQNILIDNLLQFSTTNSAIQHKQSQIKGLFFSLPYFQNNKQQIYTQINLLLSILQLYHSHTNLVMGIHSNDLTSLSDFYHLIYLSQTQFEQDNDQLIIQANCNRIFNGLPYKIDLQNMTKYGEVDRLNWGEIIRIKNGTEGLIFWFLQNGYPILNINQQINSILTVYSSSYQKHLSLIQSKYGHVLFKLKKFSKTKIQQLSFTVIIFNLKSQFIQNCHQIFQSRFQDQFKLFKKIKKQKLQENMLEKVNSQIQRLCDLLNLDNYDMSKWIIMDQKGKKDHSQNQTFSKKNDNKIYQI